MLATLGPTGNRWADLLIAAAAVIVALGVLWTKAIKPIVNGVATLERAVPVLLKIADQFTPNGGHSLRDSLDRIEGQMLESADRQDAISQKLDTLHDYAHENNHRLTGGLDTLASSYETLAPQVAAVRAEQNRLADLDRQQGGGS